MVNIHHECLLWFLQTHAITIYSIKIRNNNQLEKWKSEAKQILFDSTYNMGVPYTKIHTHTYNFSSPLIQDKKKLFRLPFCWTKRKRKSVRLKGNEMKSEPLDVYVRIEGEAATQHFNGKGFVPNWIMQSKGIPQTL